MKERICVHLTTGFYWLLSIQTRETESHEQALVDAVAFALATDLTFDYFKDGSQKMKDFIEFCKGDHPLNDSNLPIGQMTDESVMEYMSYIYLDLSEHNQRNVWVNMSNTRIDTTVYDNTVVM